MKNWKIEARSVLAGWAVVTGLALIPMQVLATEQAQQRREGRDVKQATREGSRDAKQDCRAADQKSNAGCRQDKRSTKQGGREKARDIKY